MKLVMMLLACSLSATWQQDYWPSPYSWNPYQHQQPGYYQHGPWAPRRFVPGAAQFRQRNPTQVSEKDTIQLLKMIMEQNKKDNNKEVAIDSSIEGRFNLPSFLKPTNKDKVEDKVEDRAFGLGFLGFNALANYLVNSASFTTTSTTYSTTISTITIGTVVTCYTATMFRSTTPCRRKRKLLPGILIGDDAAESFKLAPSEVMGIEPSMDNIDIVIREGRSFADDFKMLIQSSQPEVVPESDASSAVAADRFARQNPRFFGIGQEVLENLPEETLYVSTSLVTTYSLYTSSVTRTITNLVSSSSLSCLPACFTLC